MEALLDPYRRGFRARMSGALACENPYAFGSEDRRRWLKGWLDQDEHLADLDEALTSFGYGV